MVRGLMNRSERGLAPVAPLSRVFEQFFDEPFLAIAPLVAGGQQGMGVGGMGAVGFPLDLSENDQEVIVRASLPGFDQKDINVEVDDGVLSITAQHDEEHDEGDGERFYRRERRFGTVQRRISLPMPIEEEEARAEYHNGVLKLHLPKVQKAPAKKISIGGGTSGQRQVEGSSETGANQHVTGQTGQTGRNGGQRMTAGSASGQGAGAAAGGGGGNRR